MPDNESDEQYHSSTSQNGRRDRPLRASARPTFRGEQTTSGSTRWDESSVQHGPRDDDHPQPQTRRERRRLEEEARRRAEERSASPSGSGSRSDTASGSRSASALGEAAGVPAPTPRDDEESTAASDRRGDGKRGPAPRHAMRAPNRRLHFEDHRAPSDEPQEAPRRRRPAGKAAGAAAAGTAAGGTAAAGAAAGAAGAAAGGVAGTRKTAGAAAAGGTSARSLRGTRDEHRTRDDRGPRDADELAHDGSSRHSTRRSDAFPAVVGWTSLGTLFPGLAMIRSGRSRVIGWILLIGFLLGVAVVGIWVAVRGPVKVAGRFISQPSTLTALAVVLLVGAFIWFFVILRSYAAMKQGHRFSRAQRVLGSILVVSLIIIVGVPLGVGSAYAFVTGRTVHSISGGSTGKVQDADVLWKDKPRINVFLMGRDSSDTREGTRPDSMLVASIDTRTGAATLFSIPRNLNHPQFPKGSKLAKEYPQGFDGGPGDEDSLINAVWDVVTNNNVDVGDTHGLEKGMYATMEAVEGSTGLNIDYWASVNMKGFEDVVNAMGGVNIDVERPIPMGGGTNQATGGKNSIFGWIDPGPQKLKGQKALWYVRSRDGSDNYDRMCRQQRMLKTTLSQVDPQDLALAYPRLASSASENVQTDIPQQDLQAFVELANMMRKAEIKSAQINNTVIKTYSPDYPKLREWVQEQIDPDRASQKEKAESTAEPSSAQDGQSSQPAPTPANTTTANSTDNPGDSTSGAPEPGIEDDQGKCYPQGYTPGSGWPGYPGNNAGAGTK